MPKRLIRKITPDHDTIRDHKHMQVFRRFLGDPNLWHMNRRSVSGAFAVGLFWSMIPIPLQMVASAAVAIVFRVNLPLSVALVWLTNPITMPPIFYLNFLLGNWLLNEPGHQKGFEATVEWFVESMDQIWIPLYLGSLVMSIILAIVGYLSIRLFWRLHLISRIKQRRLADKLKKKLHRPPPVD